MVIGMFFLRCMKKTIESIDEWKAFLRNPLSLGFNDTLIELDNAGQREHDKKDKGIVIYGSEKT